MLRRRGRAGRGARTGAKRTPAEARRTRPAGAPKPRTERAKWVLQRSLRDTAGLAREWGVRFARRLPGALIGVWRVVARVGSTVFSLLRELAGAVYVAVGAGLRLVRRVLRVAEHVVTPARTVAVVTALAAVLIGVSQFVDYRGVAVGASAYEGIESVAPAPQTDRTEAGSAHAYVLLPVAVLALVALALACAGRWRLGRAIALLGLVGIAVSLAVDVPKGLDEGMAQVAFQGAQAKLVEGFWVQLAGSAVLVVGGILLSRYLRAGREPARPALRRWVPRMRRRKPARVAGVRT